MKKLTISGNSGRIFKEIEIVVQKHITLFLDYTKKGVTVYVSYFNKFGDGIKSTNRVNITNELIKDESLFFKLEL